MQWHVKKWQALWRAQCTPTKPQPHTHTKTRAELPCTWAIIKLQQFTDLICLLVCPYCWKLGLVCKKWQMANGSFFIKVGCPQAEQCSFWVDFSSSSPSANCKHQEAPTQLVMAWGAHGLGYEVLESVFTMAGGIVPISKSQFVLAMKNVVCLPCTLTHTLAARLLENVSYHFLSFLVLSAQVVLVATDLADELCMHQLHMMMDRKLGDIATDTTYSSAHWHANEVTTIVFNASSGCDAYATYILHTF